MMTEEGTDPIPPTTLSHEDNQYVQEELESFPSQKSESYQNENENSVLREDE